MTKKKWDEKEIDAMVRVGERNPALVPAFDDATGGAVGRKLSGHGGAREGAGRPALPDKEKSSERVMVNLTPSELDRVMALAREDEARQGTVAKRLLLWAVEQMEKRQDDE